MPKIIGNTTTTPIKVNKFVKEEVIDKRLIDLENTCLRQNYALAKEIYKINDDVSNAIKGTASGEVISITDISPIEHNMGVKLSSKNLFNNDTSLIEEVTYYGPSGTEYKRYGYEMLLPVGTYTITAIPIEELPKPYYIYGYVIDENNVITDQKISIVVSNRLYTITFTIERGQKLQIYNGSTESLNMAKLMFSKFNIQLNKGTTILPYTPYVADVSNSTLSTFGKNRFNNDTSLIKETSFYTASGSEIKKYGYEIHLPIGIYTINAIPNTELNELNPYTINGRIVDENNNNTGETVHIVVNNNLNTITFTIEKGQKLLLYCAEDILSNAKSLFSKFDIQIEVGESKTEFEQYMGNQYKPNADGTVEGVKSIYPTTTLMTDTSGVLIECEYNKDTNKVIESLVNAIISLGGNV